MQILFICTLSPDYGQSMLYDGLVRQQEAVCVYPMNPHLAGLETWEWMPKRIVNSLLIQQIDMNAYDICIVGSAKTDAIATYHTLKKIFRKMPPTFLVDGEDSDDINENAIETVKPVAIFKREMELDKVYPSNCYPCPFSAFLYDGSQHNKSLGVFAALAANHETRWQVVSELMKLNENVHVIWNGHIDYRHYLNRLRSSKIGVSVRGYGLDTVRYWEILSNPDVLLFSDKSKLQIPHSPVTGIHFIEYEVGNIVELARYYLEKDEERTRIANQGYNFCMQYHTTQARTKCVLERIGELC